MLPFPCPPHGSGKNGNALGKGTSSGSWDHQPSTISFNQPDVALRNARLEGRKASSCNRPVYGLMSGIFSKYARATAFPCSLAQWLGVVTLSRLWDRLAQSPLRGQRRIASPTSRLIPGPDGHMGHLMRRRK